MRTSSLNYFALAAVFAAGCGPGGPGSLEGFGDLGETEGPGDGEPGDGEPGDGDGDPGSCVDRTMGEVTEFFFSETIADDASSDHAGSCIEAPGPDYSVRWTAPVSGTYELLGFTAFAGQVEILQGGCDDFTINCTDVSDPLYFTASVGEDFTFVVDSAVPDSGGYFELGLSLVESSNSCPDGELFGESDTISGSTSGASNEFGSVCGGEVASDRGYHFVPPVSGIYHIDTFGSTFDTVLQVYRGDCGGQLVDCNDDAGDQLESELYVQLQAGVLYTVSADGFGNDSGNFQLNVELWEQQQQLCEGAEELGSVVPMVIEWPTDLSAGDVYHGCSFAPQELRLLWTAPDDGNYRVVQTAPNNFSALTLIAEGCAGESGPCIPAGDQGSIFEFDAFGGQEILLISEWDPAEPGTVSLSLTEIGQGGPGCGEALPAGVPSFASGNTLNGGDDYDASCSSGNAPEDEYWWTAPATGTYLLSLEGSSYDTLMFVRDGGCDGPELACNDDTFTDQGVSLWSSIQLDLVQGQTISIFVDGYNGSGSYELTITPI